MMEPEINEESLDMDDFLEEVEDGNDDEMDIEECTEESMEESVENGDRAEPSVSNSTKNNGKYFSCTKCNYVTHIRGRFTKHVKYHSMPMIKCTMCEFRTPYKWNLDRHNKNHGGTGSFHCSMCNFTADIKQSLTVHEMNHHTAVAGQSGVSRRRNRVGASDCALVEASAAPPVPKEEEGSGDSRSSHAASDMGLQNADVELISCNSDSNDATAPDAAAKRDDPHLAPDPRSRLSPHHTAEDNKSQKQKKRPPPPLIPLNTSTPTQKTEPPAKKPKTSEFAENLAKKYEHLPADITLIPVNVPTKETAGHKKNISFFDKLKARLLTETGEDGSLTCKNCGFESKCLSEHSVHEKNCSALAGRAAANTAVSSSGSTRCQNCRHRCKSSADLIIHMQTCMKNEKSNVGAYKDKNEDSEDVSIVNIEKEAEPHPMENVVFVWNNIPNQESNKFETPLDISINDDSTLPDFHKSFDTEIIDDNDSMNLSPSQAAGKKVFKCPHCPFWASTASRFHVHIVGHLNKKPFECSLCKYKSNWRWDITKHIKLKSARDPEHNNAKVLMTDETGRRNYSKYNKFLAMPIMNENGENEFHYVDPGTDTNLDPDEPYGDGNDGAQQGYDMQPLNLQTQHGNYDHGDGTFDAGKPKKTMWKCKKCNYRDPSKEALLLHVKEHSKEDDKNKKAENVPDPADLAYRCGHCNQLSNWKHVIQRHCRLKHDGIIKVITTVKPKPENPPAPVELPPDACPKCPFRSADQDALNAHLQQHQPSPLSIFKCYFCPFFVKDEQELVQHLVLHGINDPEEYIAKAMDGKWIAEDGSAKTKRHKCTECPYETNSKSQYQYHEQFHRHPANTPYKCPECNYSVSKRHLLHQHLRVHGIFPKKSEMEAELEALSNTPGSSSKQDPKQEYPILDESPYVWVSAKNEFHKMYKCRYCSYVNSQKCKLPNHEKIHCIVFDNTEITIYKCLECKFTCDNAGRLADHSKTHAEIYGRIYCPVEEDVPDEEQIAKLRKVIENERLNTPDEREEGCPDNGSVVMKYLFFCHKCPARFFCDSELKIHDKFHDHAFDNRCDICEFSTPQESELTEHQLVHTDEYHTKTKMLKFVHNTHPCHKEPAMEFAQCQTTSAISWRVSQPSKNFDDTENKKPNETKHNPKQYACKECPAKFFKCSALNYHTGLHGGDGEFKCKKCSYAVKNVGNLAKHELLHENEGKPPREYDSGDDMDYKNIPLSGTDLFQRKTEAQKRVLTDKDKLVKPNDHFPPVLQADPQFGYLMHGNPEFIYPTYLKNGRQKEKRDQQTLRLLQRRRSMNAAKDSSASDVTPNKDRKLHMCVLCPYTNQRQDALSNHYRRHDDTDILNTGNHKCSYCDLVVVQSHFLRDHQKAHFSYQKNLNPECYVANEGVSFTITKVDDELVSTDLKLDMKAKMYMCSDDKLFVKITTGELLVE
ncbi:hypothetical protein NE865_14461 [Phthorimaea operculella]|nr:hypothetical protein NE865_14461 [Phthorimaea operculella]